ncbi:unnamed protein product [Prunus brigantina]
MFTRFANIINSLKALGKDYTNVERVRKILWPLLKKWEPKVTAVREARDLSKLRKKSKKKALKVTWDDSDGSESEQNSSDNEMANFCLMEKDDEVSSSNDNSDYDNSPSYEELQDVRTLFRIPI